MLQTVLKTIERYGMFPSPGKVTVALSGGADSMALLSLLLKVRERYGLTVTAAHLNHLLRGSESERDEAFVRGVCEKLGVELAVKRLDVAALARRKGIGLELAEACHLQNVPSIRVIEAADRLLNGFVHRDGLLLIDRLRLSRDDRLRSGSDEAGLLNGSRGRLFGQVKFGEVFIELIQVE